MVLATAPVDIPALKARYSLGAVVEDSGVRLRGRGRVRQGVCPFHDEAEGSFTVYGDTERFYCFGCGAGGDVLDFVQRVEGLTLPEAMRRLEGSLHPANPSVAMRPRQRPCSGSARQLPLPPRDPGLLTAAGRFYGRQLMRHPEGRGYLASRGIGLHEALRLGVGYAPGRGLRRHLESAGFGEESLRESGLFLGRDTERFAGMIVVPDTADGLARWLGGRALDPGAVPRFQAPPGPKPVIGLGRLGRAPRWAVLTEGLVDWLVLAHWGLPACAALGTKGLEKIAGALMGCPHVFLAFDADDAGREATACLESLLGPRAAAVALPKGLGDVAELASLATGRDLFLRLLEKAAQAAR